MNKVQTSEFVFVLLEGFSALSTVSAIETLRIANKTMDNAYFRWSFASETGGAVPNSQGQIFGADCCLTDVGRDSIVVVCGGVDIARNTTPGILAWLRRRAVFGAEFIGICTAAYTLAKAGLLDGKRATIHWEESGWFEELFPKTILSERPFERAGKVATTAGGVSSIDLFLELLAERVGQEVIEEVADRLLYKSIRDIQSTTSIRKSRRIGLREPKLVHAVAIMENNIEEPINASAIADQIGISTRQLERLFKKYLNSSPGRFSKTLRLDRARQLLIGTEMTVIEIAIACGFATPSHFSKCFLQEYGTTPHTVRKSKSLVSMR